MKQLLSFLLMLMCYSSLQSQNLTGVWRGSFFSVRDVLMGGSKYRYEVQIDDSKNPLNGMKGVRGVTYSYQSTRFYGKASLEGIWTPASKNLVIREIRMDELKIEGGGEGCLMTCYFDYRKDGDKEYLEGTYTSANMKTGADCGGGKVFLEKVPDSDFEKEDFLNNKTEPQAKIKPGQEEFLVKKPTPTATPDVKTPPTKSKQTPSPVAKTKTDTKPAPKTNTNTTKTTPTKPVTSTAPAVSSGKKTEPPKANTDSAVVLNTPEKIPALKPKPPTPAVLKQRSNELFESIETNSKELIISFYDNGEVDGDTISVYVNNRLIAANKGLSTQPIVLTVKLDDDEPIHELVMVAQNLGTIPPNTALMIVQAGDKRYTVRLSSNEQKNAMVRFKYIP